MISHSLVLDEDIAARFRRVRQHTLELCRTLSAEDLQIQSMPDASPGKWHLAHTTWFFETFVLAHDPDWVASDPLWRVLFNSYYQSVGPMHARPRRGVLSRPALREVLDWRARVDDAVVALLQRDTDPQLAALVRMGCEHEQQHQELLLTDIKHAFWCNELRPAYREALPLPPPADAPALRFIAGREGIVELGHAGDGFAFDNETPRHQVLLGSHALANRLVTNGEYLAFVRDGGYRHSQLWLSDGWATVQTENWQHPLYWDDDLAREFTLAGMRGIIASEPVCHLSYYEADAFARWAGARLPTEAEWESAAADLPLGGCELSNLSGRPRMAGRESSTQVLDSREHARACTGRAIEENHRKWFSSQALSGNLQDTGRMHPQMAPADTGLTQMFGDVWEWTASPYVSYPRFQPLAGALGEYNGKFMCGQWVLRGGSCATPRDHIRASYRNFFPPQARWQFSGLRLGHDQ